MPCGRGSKNLPYIVCSDVVEIRSVASVPQIKRVIVIWDKICTT